MLIVLLLILFCQCRAFIIICFPKMKICLFNIPAITPVICLDTTPSNNIPRRHGGGWHPQPSTASNIYHHYSGILSEQMWQKASDVPEGQTLEPIGPPQLHILPHLSTSGGFFNFTFSNFWILLNIRTSAVIEMSPRRSSCFFHMFELASDLREPV